MSTFVSIVWSLAYPFLYGFLISRLFGIKKPLDQWILVCLHISAFIVSLVLFVMVGYTLRDSKVIDNTQFATAIAAVIAFFTPMFVYHGLVWQFLLRDRKLNGFLISLICCAIFVIPFVALNLTSDLI